MSDSIGAEFMEKTKYKHLTESLQRQGVPQPPLELGFDSSAALIQLPAVGSLPAYPLDLQKAIEDRKTYRRYAETALSLAELTGLLWLTQGVKEAAVKHTLRTVPSAGARHAFETYVLVNRVEGLEAGVYRYLALEHALLPLIDDADIAERIMQACGNQQHVLQSSVTFIWVAVKERMYWRYGERGYRYLHLDAGHVCQNLYLAAEAIHCGVCAIAAFDDDQLNAALGLDGERHFAVYLATLGKKP